MNRRRFMVSSVVGIVGLSEFSPIFGQSKPTVPDLGGMADAKTLKLFNRSASRLDEGTRHGVRLNATPGEGVAFLPGIEFSYGTIEVDLRGKDVAQQSFVGIAFHGVDQSVHDAVYFRPFNFKVADPVGNSHSVQYHSLPVHPWQKLRADEPGKYEHAVDPVPDPNGWFHARVVVAKPQVTVFVNDGAQPCLTVNLLNDRKEGLVGLWVGNNSGGDFANLTIVHAAG